MEDEISTSRIISPNIPLENDSRAAPQKGRKDSALLMRSVQWL